MNFQFHGSEMGALTIEQHRLFCPSACPLSDGLIAPLIVQLERHKQPCMVRKLWSLNPF
jgi:hypothetical protein